MGQARLHVASFFFKGVDVKTVLTAMRRDEIEGVHGPSYADIVTLQPFNAENYGIVTETGDEKVGGFRMGGDVNVQMDKVGKFSRRHGTTVCEFKDTGFLHGGEEYAVVVRERRIYKGKSRCSTINQCISLESDFSYGNNERHNQMPSIHFSSDRGSLDRENAEIEIDPSDTCLRLPLRPKTELFPPPELSSSVHMSSF